MDFYQVQKEGSVKTLSPSIRIVIGSVATLFLASSLIGCTQNTSPKSPNSEQKLGTSSGGGGFGDENSLLILKWSKEILASSIRRANPSALKGLPMGWSPERLAKLIESTRPQPNSQIFRYNRELMFDYKIPKTGEPYLVATSLFFRSHAAIPVNGMLEGQIEPYIREVFTKLLHEASHVLGIGLTETSDYKARGFAVHLKKYLGANNIVCSAKEVSVNYPGYVPESTLEQRVREEMKSLYGQTLNEEEFSRNFEEAKQQPYYWVLNRPTGFALHSYKSSELKKGEQIWLDRLLNGIPNGGYYSFVALQIGRAHV